MKIWIDPKLPAPVGYIWCKTIDDAKDRIQECESSFATLYRQGIMDKNLLIDYIDVFLNDYELREFVRWNSITNRNYQIRYHESTRRMKYCISGHNRSGVTCDSWEEFIIYLTEERDKFERYGSDIFEVSISNTPSHSL